MSVDELRAGLARVAATVVPDEEPYARLMRHARRRRRRRFAGFAAAVAALLAAALAGPAAFSAAGLDGRFDGMPPSHGYPVDSPWSWRLIDSPTRGNLAGDRKFLAEVTRLFDQERDSLHVAADLPTVKVLWADESAGLRHVMVVFHSETHAALHTREARVGASPRQLLRGDGLGNGRVTPFTLVSAVSGMPGRQKQWLLGLAPAGCTVSVATSATVAGGEVRRQWAPSPGGDHLLVGEFSARGWWRIECDGQVRQEGPIGYRHDIVGKSDAEPVEPLDARPAPAPTIREWRLPRDAATSYRTLTDTAGLVGASAPVIRWAGRLDPDDETETVLLGPPEAGPLLLQVGAGDGGLLALATPEQATPDDTETHATSRAQVPLVATGIAPGPELAVVRVPTRSGGHAALTDRLLVVPGRTTAVRVEAVADGGVRATAPVRDGAAQLTLPVGVRVELRALDGDGKVVATGPLAERADGERIFNEQVVTNW